jgi:hypothetical protein
VAGTAGERPDHSLRLRQPVDQLPLPERKGTRFERSHTFEGIIPNLERRYRGSDSNAVREELAKYISNSACPTCAGTRLRTEARHVRVGDKTLHEISRLPLGEARNYFNCLALTGAKAQVADKILKEITARLSFLINVGLDYLCLERSAETLSGGEAQRIRLASQIGSGLTGVMYVLDEPSIGLHQRDNDRLLETLKNLRDMGNTVLVVEHDEDAIRSADYVVDIGPGAGVHGGSIVAEGTGRGRRQPGIDDRRLPVRPQGHRCPQETPAAEPGEATEGDRRPRQQPARRHAGNPRRAAHLHHRRVRFRQIDADQRHAVRGCRQAPLRLQHRTGAVQGNHRPRPVRQGDQRRPGADRPHAALQPGDLHRPADADPRTVLASAGIAGAATAPAASASTSRAGAAKPARATA